MYFNYFSVALTLLINLRFSCSEVLYDSTGVTERTVLNYTFSDEFTSTQTPILDEPSLINNSESDRNIWNTPSDGDANLSLTDDELLKNSSRDSLFVGSPNGESDILGRFNEESFGKTEELLGKAYDMLQEQRDKQDIINEEIKQTESVVQKLLSRKRVMKNDDGNVTDVQQLNEFSLQSLEHLLDVYSPSRLSKVWNRTKDLHLTSQCYKDVRLYLNALQRGTLWALQSE